MKKIILIVLLFLLTKAFGQTNTFPVNGNVGIGTINPTEDLDVNGNMRVNRLRTGSAAFTTNSRSSFNSFNSGNVPTLHQGWIAADFGGNADLADRLVVGTGFGGKVVIGTHNYNLETWGGPLLISPLSGNVGIGTVNPNYKLDVGGQSNINGQGWFSYGSNNISGYSWTDAAVTTNSIEIVNNNGVTTELSPTLAFHRYGSGGPQFRLAPDGSNVLYLESSGANSARKPNPYGGGSNLYFSRFHVDAELTTSGNIGIGVTDTKGYKLAVAGNMIVESIKVQLQGSWPDFVFAKDYKLSTLQETEKHIKEKGHLPGIPSAAEVKANGIDLGEMNARLLQKIEELTLYLIGVKKEVATLSSKVVEQTNQINQLKKKRK